ncbi:MAG: hypothetical protein ACI97A_003952 [Planctomycetota bacterium]|jgi:hypothetical protein
MINCKPRGLCSWNYRLESNGESAVTSIESMAEEGTIESNGRMFRIKKHGVMSGHWTLEHDGVVLSQAFKKDVMTRTFDVQAADYDLQVKAQAAFGRDMVIAEGEKVIAKVKPVHSFTRRATIDVYHEGYDFVVLAFSFWLITLIWRRHAGSV